MTALTFYASPQSRGQIVRWMLEELEVPCETAVLEYGTSMKARPAAQRAQQIDAALMAAK